MEINFQRYTTCGTLQKNNDSKRSSVTHITYADTENFNLGTGPSWTVEHSMAEVRGNAAQTHFCFNSL